MNEQQGKHLDQRVRQALDSLPDVPAPGTTFNAGKLWEQLRPELASQPIARTRRLGLVWWMAAASLAGVLLAWFWWPQHPLPGQTFAKQPKTAKPDAGYVPATEAGIRIATTKSQAGSTETGNGRQQGTRSQGSPDDALVAASKHMKPTEATQPATAGNVPEQLAAATSTVNSEPVSQPPIIAAVHKPVVTAPKRLFQVVHENELKAEEEALSVQVRTKGSSDRFVRLGTGGSPVSANSDEPSPTILLPLNRKSTQ
jgi:hypothetical protein